MQRTEHGHIGRRIRAGQSPRGPCGTDRCLRSQRLFRSEHRTDGWRTGVIQGCVDGGHATWETGRGAPRARRRQSIPVTGMSRIGRTLFLVAFVAVIGGAAWVQFTGQRTQADDASSMTSSAAAVFDTAVRMENAARDYTVAPRRGRTRQLRRESNPVGLRDPPRRRRVRRRHTARAVRRRARARRHVARHGGPGRRRRDGRGHERRRCRPSRGARHAAHEHPRGERRAAPGTRPARSRPARRRRDPWPARRRRLLRAVRGVELVAVRAERTSGSRRTRWPTRVRGAAPRGAARRSRRGRCWLDTSNWWRPTRLCS